MDIHEYQAAEIFARYGIPTSNGTMATTPDEVAAAAGRIGGTVVLKSQVHIGGRGKAGGIKLAKSPDEARTLSEQIFGMDIRGHRVNRIYVVPAAKIASEYYLGVTLDRGARQITLIASAEGGVEIEEVARTNPGAILRVPVDPVRGLLPYQALGVAFALNVPGEAASGFAEIARKLVDVYLKEDASLAEINPMARLEDGSWLAADTKMVFDDNALFRHKGVEDLRDMAEENAAELDAKAAGISFVQLDGTIGCVVNGAGLAMATMDAVKQAGGDPANFLDVGGGAKANQVAKALGFILADDRVSAVLFNIFGGITRGDEVARGLIAGTANLPRRVPIIVRLSGTNAEEGREILKGTEIRAAETMQEAARLAVAAANGD